MNVPTTAGSEPFLNNLSSCPHPRRALGQSVRALIYTATPHVVLSSQVPRTEDVLAWGQIGIPRHNTFSLTASHAVGETHLAVHLHHPDGCIDHPVALTCQIIITHGRTDRRAMGQ